LTRLRLAAPDVDQATARAPRAVAQLGAHRTGEFPDLLHRTRQHPYAVAQQRTVARMVAVGFDDGGVHATIFFSRAMTTTR
jgi:hypothetical protein